MDFDQALKGGELDRARELLEELAGQPETEKFSIADAYEELARALDRAKRHDDAIAAMEHAIQAGWNGVPDGRSDIAEFHLNAGRTAQASAIWAELRAQDPDEIWLYNNAGMSFTDAGEHDLAVAWLGEGIELAMGTGDPEGIVAQMSDFRRRSLEQLGREPDELEQRVDPFLEQWRANPPRRPFNFTLPPPPSGPTPNGPFDPEPEGESVAVAMAWFPAGDYERAIDRWPSLAEDWQNVSHQEYCRRMEGQIKWMRRHGIPIQAVNPIELDDYLAWCQEHDEDPEDARAAYSAERFGLGHAIPWPPSRNEPCWCGSTRKYKKCCGPTDAAPMHDEDA